MKTFCFTLLPLVLSLFLVASLNSNDNAIASNNTYLIKLTCTIGEKSKSVEIPLTVNPEC